MRADLVMVGYRLNAKEPAPKALERILGLSPEAARSAARGFPATLLSDVPEAEAERIAGLLREAGGLVDVRTRAAPEAVSETGQRAAARPREGVMAAEFETASAAVASGAASYQLGDFGLGPQAEAPAAPPASEAPRPAPEPPPAREQELSLDFDFASAQPLELELERPENQNTRSATSAAQPDRDARFSDAAPPLAGPEVEAEAFRAVQRAPRPHESRASAPPARARASSRHVTKGWVSSVLLLALLVLGTLATVGYALDPGDPVGALRRSGAWSADLNPPHAPGASEMHPLLTATPAALHAPLAAILRAQVPGVHSLPASFQAEDGRTVDCFLVDERGGDLHERLGALRRTGTEVRPPSGAAAALREHTRALRASEGRGALPLKPLCLAP